MKISIAAACMATFVSGVASIGASKGRDTGTFTSMKNGVKLTASVEPGDVRAGESAELSLLIQIPRGLHIYGSKDGSFPSKVSISEDKHIRADEVFVPEGVRHQVSNGPVNYWLTGRQTIRQKFNVSANAKDEVALRGVFHFMVCTDKSCKPPAKIPFKLAVGTVTKRKTSSVKKGKAKYKRAKHKRMAMANAEFKSPVRLEVDRAPLRVEAPGYATPCLADMNGDGRKDLLVGRYAKGQINVHRNLGKGRFAAGKPLAEVPGIW